MTTPHIDKSTIEIEHIAAASVTTPSANQLVLFANTSNSDHISIKDSSGTTTDLQGGGTTSFTDNTFEIKDNSDATKKIAFEASGITTATTRTLTVPDKSGTIAVITSSTVSFPKRAEIDARTFNQPVGTVGITSAAQSSQYGGGYSNQTTAANNDEITSSFWLAAGTYTLNVFGSTNTNAAKIDWYIDGSITGITGQDWYSGSQVFNVSKTGSITVTGDGYHTLKGKINGRNASNTTGYYWLIGKVSIYPSAD
jgi:hypothetical protein